MAFLALLVSNLAKNGAKYQMCMCLDSKVVQSEFPVEVKGCIWMLFSNIVGLSGLQSWLIVDLSTPPFLPPPLMGQKRVTVKLTPVHALV